MLPYDRLSPNSAGMGVASANMFTVYRTPNSEYYYIPFANTVMRVATFTGQTWTLSRVGGTDKWFPTEEKDYE